MTPAELLADPEYLPFRLDPVGRRVLFVRIDRETRQQAAFLDDRLLTGNAQGAWLSLEALPPPPALVTPLHFIFHIGHCGSTLLSRLLQSWPRVQSLREPLPLRTLAEARLELGRDNARFSATQWQNVLHTLLALWARPLAGIDVTTLKATSSCNGMIEPILATSLTSRAILLDMPLEPYLATLFKSPDSVRDVAAAAAERRAFLGGALQDELPSLDALSLPQLCALGWLAEQLRFTGLAKGEHASRVLRVRFDALLQQPEPTLQRIAAHLGGPEDAVSAALASPAWGRYSKAQDHAYGSADRAFDLDESRRRHAPRIREGLDFVAELQRRHPALANLP
jgi:hypothetical protein